jgi:hypothetical protein
MDDMSDYEYALCDGDIEAIKSLQDLNTEEYLSRKVSFEKSMRRKQDALRKRR